MQILARGNSGATGMESKTQYIDDVTPKRDLVCMCLCVREKAVLYVRNVQVCVFVREQGTH